MLQKQEPFLLYMKEEGHAGFVSGPLYWCLKSMKREFDRAKEPCLKNLHVLSPRIDTKKITDDTLQYIKENV